MRKQQLIWEKEHADKKTLPTMANESPASGVIKFVDFLESIHFPLEGKAIDIGCGKGRNSLYLAGKGFEVFAVDYIKSALQVLERLAVKTSLEDKIHIKQFDVDKKWPLEDNYFNLAIDSFSSIDIETLEGRQVYRDEMFRTLRQKGYALITVVSVDDELEKSMIIQSPGSEKNSTIWPSGKFQKDYESNELKEFYKNFTIIALEEIKKPAFKLGKDYVATNYWLILQKP